MGFSQPKQLESWLNNDWRRPPQNFVDCSLYYAGLDVFFKDYMNNVVRPCVAYSSGSADNTINSGIKLNVGMAIKAAATRLVKGDKILFEGGDTACRALSDIWAPEVGFETFLESAIDYMLAGGTVAVKLNMDAHGRIYPTATRIDRYYAETDDLGEVQSITFFNSLLYSEKFGRKSSNQYWLVEERYYRDGTPVVVNKIHWKSGVAGKETLPSIGTPGIEFQALPEAVQRILNRRGIVVNEERPLPFGDGLGVWLWRRTANNSCVPGLSMGDPLLYGALDIIWAIDVVFSGSVTDVLLGKGKILVPKKYLTSVREDLKALGIKTEVAVFNDDLEDTDESLVYVLTEQDKDFTPQSVQFEIRSESYRGMLEIYLRQAAVHCGFAPTSIFPFLQDQSAKTATEVTAEENLTRASVQSLHQTIVPAINRMLEEVLKQYGFKETARIKLSDYIGNKLQRDQNIRNNYAAGLIPREVAVQHVNDISAGETAEYIQKIDADQQARRNAALGGGFFNDRDYFGGDGIDSGGIG